MPESPWSSCLSASSRTAHAMQGEEQHVGAQGCPLGSCQREGLGALEQKGWMQRDVLGDAWGRGEADLAACTLAPGTTAGAAGRRRGIFCPHLYPCISRIAASVRLFLQTLMGFLLKPRLISPKPWVCLAPTAP